MIIESVTRLAFAAVCLTAIATSYASHAQMGYWPPPGPYGPPPGAYGYGLPQGPYGVVCVKFSKSGMGGGLAELRAKATSLCSIENNHPFVPTCLLAERRAQRQSRMPW